MIIKIYKTEELLICQNLYQKAFSGGHSCNTNISLCAACSCFSNINFDRQREKSYLNLWDYLLTTENEYSQKWTYKQSMNRYWAMCCALTKPVISLFVPKNARLTSVNGLFSMADLTIFNKWCRLIKNNKKNQQTNKQKQHSKKDMVWRNIDPEQRTKMPWNTFSLWAGIVTLE